MEEVEKAKWYSQEASRIKECYSNLSDSEKQQKADRMKERVDEMTEAEREQWNETKAAEKRRNRDAKKKQEKK